jgi:tRNA(Arg) A34 adenosine deaminase TadA
VTNNDKDDNEDKDLQLRASNLVTILLGNPSTDLRSPQEILKEMLHPVMVPAKPPQSQVQANIANQLWPTHFFPLKSIEYRHQQLTLSQSDLSGMVDMMEKVQSHNAPVAIVVDPSTFTVVATSWDEQKHQVGSTNNPLSTPILWAIQGVSRLERNNDFTNPHYLCTNFDLYCNYDPTIFEAMSCVHSRFGRVVFSRQHDTTREQEGIVVWRNGLSRHAIHCLPGTNHHFRAFEYTTIAG